MITMLKIYTGIMILVLFLVMIFTGSKPLGAALTISQGRHLQGHLAKRSLKVTADTLIIHSRFYIHINLESSLIYNLYPAAIINPKML